MQLRAVSRYVAPLLVVGCLGVGCNKQPAHEDRTAVLSRLTEQGHAADATLAGGSVRYLGFVTDPLVAKPGESVTVTDYWECLKPLTRDYEVFTHVLVEGAVGWVPSADYAPTPKTSQWKVGEIYEQKHAVKLPARIPGTTLDIRVGMFLGKERLAVDDVAIDDGQRRIRAGRIAVKGTPVPLPLYEVAKTDTAPTIDGVLTEWNGVTPIDVFTVSRGDAASRWRTTVRATYDDTNLYLAWDVQDPDIRGTMRTHDQQIYREEAVEIFIDARGDGSEYVELQSSPLGVTFDAAFKGGPRQNMDVHYDADFTAACTLRGTIEKAADIDDGWSCEWRVGLASIRGATLPITPKTRWRANFFHIAKDAASRVPGEQGDRVINDESAWSPPLMGDFHNLERFGTLAFRAPVRDGGSVP